MVNIKSTEKLKFVHTGVFLRQTSVGKFTPHIDSLGELLPALGSSWNTMVMFEEVTRASRTLLTTDLMYSRAALRDVMSTMVCGLSRRN